MIAIGAIDQLMPAQMQIAEGYLLTSKCEKNLKFPAWLA